MYHCNLCNLILVIGPGIAGMIDNGATGSTSASTGKLRRAHKTMRAAACSRRILEQMAELSNQGAFADCAALGSPSQVVTSSCAQLSIEISRRLLCNANRNSTIQHALLSDETVTPNARPAIISCICTTSQDGMPVDRVTEHLQPLNTLLFSTPWTQTHSLYLQAHPHAGGAPGPQHNAASSRPLRRSCCWRQSPGSSSHTHRGS